MSERVKPWDASGAEEKARRLAADALLLRAENRIPQLRSAYLEAADKLDEEAATLFAYAGALRLLGDECVESIDEGMCAAHNRSMLTCYTEFREASAKVLRGEVGE